MLNNLALALTVGLIAGYILGRRDQPEETTDDIDWLMPIEVVTFEDIIAELVARGDITLTPDETMIQVEPRCTCGWHG